MRAAIKSTLTAAVIAALACVAAPMSAFANGLPEKTTADMIKVAPSSSATVYKHGLCRKVKNDNTDPVLVPLNTAAEWAGASGFITNIASMPKVSLTRCAPSGYDLAFCYYMQNSGGHGQYCGPTSVGSRNPRLIYTAGAFASDPATLKEVMNIAEHNRCAGEDRASSILFSDPQRAYDSVKNKIDWSSGRDWCFVFSYSYISDHMMEGGDSGSGANSTYAYMRVWNPNAN